MISTGTPPGAGFAPKLPIWMKPGDVCEIEKTGVLRSPAVAENP